LLTFYLMKPSEVLKNTHTHKHKYTPESEIIEIKRVVYKFLEDKCSVLIQHVFLSF